MRFRGNGGTMSFSGSIRFYSRLTPSLSNSCYLARIEQMIAAEWFLEKDFCDLGEEGPLAKEIAYDHALDWYHKTVRNDWVQHGYVFVSKPIWDAEAYIVDVGLTDMGEHALRSIRQGYVWDHPDLVDGSRGINIPDTLKHWRRLLGLFHPDTPIQNDIIELIRSVSRLDDLELHALADDLDNAIQAHAAGLFWDADAREIDIEKSLNYWRSRIKSIETHDDPLFKRISAVSQHPALKPILSELLMWKILLE